MLRAFITAALAAAAFVTTFASADVIGARRPLKGAPEASAPAHPLHSLVSESERVPTP